MARRASPDLLTSLSLPNQQGCVIVCVWVKCHCDLTTITRSFSPRTAYVQPLCLPTPGDPLPAEAKVVAWTNEHGEGSLAEVFDNVLLEVKQPLVDVVTCNSTWNGILGDSQVSVIFLCQV